MAKRIYSNGDCKVDLSEFKDIIDNSVSFKVVFFVNSASVNVEKNSLNEDYTVNLVWDELQPLGRGILQYILYYGNSDTAFADGEYNSSEIRTTNYFIMSDIQITDDVTTNVNMSDVLRKEVNTVVHKIYFTETGGNEDLRIIYGNIDYGNLTPELLTQEIAEEKTIYFDLVFSSGITLRFNLGSFYNADAYLYSYGVMYEMPCFYVTHLYANGSFIKQINVNYTFFAPANSGQK